MSPVTCLSAALPASDTAAKGWAADQAVAAVQCPPAVALLVMAAVQWTPDGTAWWLPVPALGLWQAATELAAAACIMYATHQLCKTKARKSCLH